MILFIQNINRKIEVSRKCYPEKIRNLQICGHGSDAVIFYNRQQNQSPESNKPDKRKQICLHIEENYAPEEVENLVVIPLENTINGATGVERTTSIAAVGYGVVKAEFGWDTDVFKARQIINEKIGQVSSYLPLGTKIVMTPISSIMGEVMFIGLTTKDNSTSPMKLREIAETKMADLNAYDVDAAMKIIEGTARNMGIVVED